MPELDGCGVPGTAIDTHQFGIWTCIIFMPTPPLSYCRRMWQGEYMFVVYLLPRGPVNLTVRQLILNHLL